MRCTMRVSVTWQGLARERHRRHRRRVRGVRPNRHIVVPSGRRRAPGSWVCGKVVFNRWQVPEGRKVRSTSWWEHGCARRSGNTHRVGVAVDDSSGSVQWNSDSCRRTRPVAALVITLFVPLASNEAATPERTVIVHVICSRRLVEQAFFTTKKMDALGRDNGRYKALFTAKTTEASESGSGRRRRSARLRAAWWKRNLRNVSHIVIQCRPNLTYRVNVEVCTVGQLSNAKKSLVEAF